MMITTYTTIMIIIVTVYIYDFSVVFTSVKGYQLVIINLPVLTAT
jgi:hypothetical protein